ncbi:unannotated protein [freshwater metagenome]|uniref:Unannotated protein n=1 Tax=freshwater metagenome TaxID=449393 RepID=A0A6J5YX86_9ZZZZ
MYRIPLPEKATLLIKVRLLGNEIVLRFCVPANAKWSMLASVEFAAKVTEVRLTLSQKAPYAIEVTLAGIVTLVIPLSWKAP